jgi:hypothetical protein
MSSQNNSPLIFNSNVVKAFQKFISIKQFCQSILCEYTQKGKLRVIKSYFKKFKFLLGLIFCVIYAFYLIIQLVTQITAKHKAPQYFVGLLWTFLWATYYTWSVGNYFNIICKQEDSVTFIEGMILLDLHLSGNKYHFKYPEKMTKLLFLGPSKTKPVKREKLKEMRLELFIIVEDIMIFSFAACSTIMAVTLSKRPQFISSLNSGEHSITFLFLLAIFTMYLVAVTSGALFFITNYITLYTIFSMHWVNILRKATRNLNLNLVRITNFKS